MIEEITYHIISCFLSAFFLFIWFNTEAFLEYIKLFRLDSLFFIKEYEESKEVIEDLTYPSYLEINHKDFFNKVLSCIFCFSVWVVFYTNVMLCIKFGIGTLKFFGADWFFTLLIYFSSCRYFNK